MTEDDDQEKATRKTRGVPISLGLWWWSEIERAFGSRKNVVLAEMISAASDPPTTWTGDEISKLRRHVTDPTLPLIQAISRAFGLISPVFIAGSLEEAQDLNAVKLAHERRRAERVRELAEESEVAKDVMHEKITGQLTTEEINEMNAAIEKKNLARALKNAKARKRREIARDRHKNH